MAASTRPLTLGEILDRTVQIYRRSFLLFVGIAVLPSAFEVLISGIFSIYSTSLLPGFKGNKPGDFQGMLALIAAFGLFFLIGVPILLALYAVTQSALTNAALEAVAGRFATVRASYGYGFHFFWRNVGILFLQALFAGILPSVAFGILIVIFALIAAVLSAAVGKGFIILAVLAYIAFFLSFFVVIIWIWLRVSLAFPASVAEGKRAWDAVKRSNQLSRGTCGRIFVMYLLIVVLTLIVNYALVIPLDVAMGLNVKKFFEMARAGGTIPIFIQVANLVVSFLIRTFVLPIPAIALVLFYNDQRTRNEGYDIEQLMSYAGWSEMPPPAPMQYPGAPAPEPTQLPPMQIAETGHAAIAPAETTLISTSPVPAAPVESAPMHPTSTDPHLSETSAEDSEA